MGLISVRLGAYCQLVFEVSDLDEVADGVVGQVPEGSAGRLNPDPGAHVPFCPPVWVSYRVAGYRASRPWVLAAVMSWVEPGSTGGVYTGGRCGR